MNVQKAEEATVDPKTREVSAFDKLWLTPGTRMPWDLETAAIDPEQDPDDQRLIPSEDDEDASELPEEDD